MYRNSLNGLFMVSKRNTSGAVLLVRWKWAWHADGGRPARWECPIACRTHWPPPDVARFLLASEGFFWDACDPGLHTLVPSSAVHREALCCCCLLSSMFLLLPFVESHPLPRAPRAAEELLESGLSSGPLLLGTVGGGGAVEPWKLLLEATYKYHLSILPPPPLPSPKSISESPQQLHGQWTNLIFALFNKSYHEPCPLSTWSATSGNAEESLPNTELKYVESSWEEILGVRDFFPPFLF